MKIPEYIEKYIYDDLDGVYEPGTNIDTNIENNENDNKRYLGTYFPRSLIENFLILCDLYKNQKIKSVIDNLENINILDFGTGTGGNIIAFMHFLKKIQYPTEKVRFVTIEGNEIAIEYQVKLFKKFNSEFGTKFKLMYEQKKFSLNTIENESKATLKYITEKYNIDKYDFITSSKFISEFYNSNFYLADGQKLYKTFIKFSGEYLTENGILLFLDLVSGNYDHNVRRPYTTQIMSNEVKKYLKDNNKNSLKILLPAPCSHWAHRCSCNDCYIQRTFEIEHLHTKGKNDLSNVSYFVFAKTDFANSILASLTEKNSYTISHNKWHPGYCEKSSRKEGNIDLPDGFKIN